MHCKRSTGTLRKYFPTVEEARAFAADPKNTEYHEDVVTLCRHCGYFHLSHPTWLADKPWEIPVAKLAVN